MSGVTAHDGETVQLVEHGVSNSNLIEMGRLSQYDDLNTDEDSRLVKPDGSNAKRFMLIPQPHGG
jgi:hypothetical protein